MPTAPHLLDVARRAGILPTSILDVGATDRMHEAGALQAWPGAEYRSLDIDRTNKHDYYGFDEVDRTFDLILLLEVLEHVPHKVALDIMIECFRVCAADGHILASVPNVLGPGTQHEWTHIAAFHYMDLCGLAAWTGFKVVSLCRIYRASARGRLLHTTLAYPLHRLLQVDFAQSIAVLAKKPG